jgi:hypothetical protein
METKYLTFIKTTIHRCRLFTIPRKQVTIFFLCCSAIDPFADTLRQGHPSVGRLSTEMKQKMVCRVTFVVIPARCAFRGAISIVAG